MSLSDIKKNMPEMKREELLKALFAELEGKAYNAEYHNYYYKEANQVIRAFFERTFPPAECARKVQWSGYGELGNISQKPLQPPAEGAEEILKEGLDDGRYADIVDGINIDVKQPFYQAIIRYAEDVATLHTQRLAEKMKDANQFILDIARVFGIETDGVGFDGLTLSIDDFKEAAEKMVGEKLREELMTYDKFLSNTYWGISHITKREEAVNEYLKSREEKK